MPADATGRLRDPNAASHSKLSTRLWYLGAYIVRVAHQPAAVWWAAHQPSLHPDVVRHLEWALRREADRFPAGVLRAWRLIISAWGERRLDPNQQRYEIEAIVAQSDWSTETVRATVKMYRPTLVVQAPMGSQPPSDKPDLKLDKMLRVDVEYPRPHEPLTIPPEHLPYAVSLLRGQIEHAIVLESEVRGNDGLYFDATRADDGEMPDEDGFRLTGLLATFVNMMVRLAEADPAAAKAEFSRWPTDQNPVFTRLRIWAASQPAILDSAQAGVVFLSLDDKMFWTDQQERDLLYALRDRWSELSGGDRELLEQRLLTGSFPWPEPRDDRALSTAYYRLNRLQWLRDQGVNFGFDIDAEMARNRLDAPGWEPRFAERAAQPKVGKVRSISTETDPTALEGLPIGRVLAAAREASGSDFETFINHRPFVGLAEKRPAFALAVLTDASRKKEFPEAEWAALLQATSKADLKPCLLRAIGFRLARLAPEQLAVLRHPVSEWMRDRAATLIVNLPDVFGPLWDALAYALTNHPPKDRFRAAGQGWVNDGLNQPTGRLVDALLKDPAKNGLEPGKGLPETWKARLDQLFALPGDARRHAIAMISPHLNWLYNIDPDWAESRLLAVVDGNTPDAQAFWEGYFWAARTPQLPLYMRLKPAFISLARSGSNQRDHANKLAGMLLAGWAGSDDVAQDDVLIPDVELREVLIHGDDELRTQILWYLQRWSNEPGSKWGERILPFLKEVWPRQRAVRTPRTSSRLADLALSMPDRFVEIAELVIPLLGRAVGPNIPMGPSIFPDEGIAARHPSLLLDLLWKILPEDAWLWPNETKRILDALGTQAEVKDDLRLNELERRERYK